MAYEKRFDASLTISLPSRLNELVDRASKSQFTNASTYVRQALAKSLKADGFDLDAA